MTPIIIQWNANGLALRIKLGELERLLTTYNPICLCVQHVGKADVNVKNYKLVAQSDVSNGELGTAIYIHNLATYEQLQIDKRSCQPTGITLHIKGIGKINILNLYNQPKFKYSMKDAVEIIRSVKHPKLVLGDLNSHNPMWDPSCEEADRGGKILEDAIGIDNLECLNEEGTYTFFSKIHSSRTTVDITLRTIGTGEDISWNVLDDTYTSDHNPILITMNNGGLYQQKPTRYRTNQADWGSHRSETEKIEEFNERLSTEELYRILKTKIEEAAEKHIPKTKEKRRKKTVPWWSEELQKLVDEKHKITNALSRKRNLSNKIKAKQINGRSQDARINKLEEEISKMKPESNKAAAKFRKAALKAKTESWKRYVSTLNSNTPMQKIWKRFNKINGAQRRSHRHAITYKGERIHEPKEMSNAFGKHLQTVSSDESYTNKFRKYKRKKEKTEIKFEDDNQRKEYYNKAFTIEELDAALEGATKSSPGGDNIDFEMIKHLSTRAKEFLLKIYNKIWDEGVVIKEWKSAIVIPIPKPGKDPSNVTNYRPISLTSCMCKTLEKMVNVRLTHYLRQNKIVSEKQFGAMKMRSTLDPLTLLEHQIRDGFKRKTPTVAIFYDISKAYDTTWRYQVKAKLKEINLRGQLPKFLDNFLSNRTFRVRVENELSNEYELKNGIPQGSVLSCAIFWLAIGSITGVIHGNMKFSLYMDDFVIYISSRALRSIARQLNIANRKIEKWQEMTGFEMSTDKTKIVVFYKDKRWIKNQECKVTLSGHNIPIEEKYKFLGMWFDSHLNWGYHIAYVKNKCKKALNIIKKLSHTDWGADRKTLRTLYQATVVPILDYGSPVYSSASRAKLRQLDPIHNEGARQITGAFRSSPAASLQVECGNLPLDYHRELIQLKAALRIKTTDSPASKLFDENDDYATQAPFTITAQRKLKQLGIEIPQRERREEIPPWLRRRPEICTGLFEIDKKENPHIIKSKAIEHMRSKQGKYEIYTDGSKSEQGVGSAAITRDKTIKRSLGIEASVYTAELTAIKYAIEIIKEKNEKDFVIYSDSRSAIMAMFKFQPTNHIVNDIQDEISSLLTNGKNITICWIPAHVGLRGNEAADQAAKTAIREQRASITMPAKDLHPSLRTKVTQKWQRIWEIEPIANKLRSIRDNVTPWDNYYKDRSTEVTMARLRIGHTRLTHCHYMENPNGPPPTCNACKVQLTVKHIIEECPLVAQQRRETIGEKKLAEILGPQANAKSVMEFLKKIGIDKVI